MDQTNNIIMFPGVTKIPEPNKQQVPFPDDPEELDHISMDVMNELTEILLEYGVIVDLDNFYEDNPEDLSLIYNSIKSYIYKTRGKYHFLQDNAKTLFEVFKEEDENQE